MEDLYNSLNTVNMDIQKFMLDFVNKTELHMPSNDTWLEENKIFEFDKNPLNTHFVGMRIYLTNDDDIFAFIVEYYKVPNKFRLVYSSSDHHYENFEYSFCPDPALLPEWLKVKLNEEYTRLMAAK